MTDRRWRCPGPLCGDYQGYQRGCRQAACLASVAPYSAQRVAAAGPTSRRTRIDDDAKALVLRVLRAGGTLADGCRALGVTDYRLRSARRRDPDWDAEIKKLSSRPLGHRKLTDADTQAFLAALRSGWPLLKAADRIGWDYSTFHGRRLNDPEFDAAVVRAAADGADDHRPGPLPRLVHRINRREGDDT